MATVLLIIGAIFAFYIVPIATILGLIGFWGALAGVILGMFFEQGE